MPSRKYISKINKGGNDIYIKDAEAREALSIYEDVYIGAGATSASVIVAANHHDTMAKGDHVSLTASSSYVWIVLPTTYSPILAMAGMELPMSLDSTTTIESVTYNIWKSSNSYSGTFNIYLL